MKGDGVPTGIRTPRDQLSWAHPSGHPRQGAEERGGTFLTHSIQPNGAADVYLGCLQVEESRRE
jgi:hypothetical protein